MLQTELTNSLTDAQIIALEALLEGDSITEAAAKCDKHRTTVSKWVNHDADFAAALRESRMAALEAGLTILQTEASNMARTLVNIAKDEQAGRRDRVSAASKDLDLSLKISESQEIDCKIAEIEQMLQDHAD